MRRKMNLTYLRPATHDDDPLAVDLLHGFKTLDSGDNASILQFGEHHAWFAGHGDLAKSRVPTWLSNHFVFFQYFIPMALGAQN